MKFSEARTVIPALLDAGIAVHFYSAPGVGKSEFTAELSKEQAEKTGEPHGLASAFLATYTPPDLIGYQFKGSRQWDGKEVAVTEPTLPLWMITSEGKPTWAYKRGYLLLDEFGQAEAEVKRASAELLLNKKIGPWKLGAHPDGSIDNSAGWGVICCSNRAEDRSGVTKTFDFLVNRQVHVDITPDVGDWTEWAMTHGVSPVTVGFANNHPEIIFTGKVPEKQEPFCTPRSTVRFDSVMQKLAGEKGEFPESPTIIEMAKGMIGMAAAAQYFADLKIAREMPKYERIIARPSEVRVPEKADAQMLVCYNLAHRVQEEHAQQVLTYIERMPKEFAVTFAKAACRRLPSLVATKPFQEWALRNSSLMAQVAL